MDRDGDPLVPLAVIPAKAGIHFDLDVLRRIQDGFQLSLE